VLTDVLTWIKETLMNLTDAWNWHKAEAAALREQVVDLGSTNDQLTQINADLAAQLDAANAARTTPAGYEVDAKGPDGEIIDEIVSSAEPGGDA
jgi:hypothetical protein